MPSKQWVAVKILLVLPPEGIAAAQTSWFRRAGVNAAALVADLLQPLTPEEELEVALGILIRVSWAFEDAQFAFVASKVQRYQRGIHGATVGGQIMSHDVV